MTVGTSTGSTTSIGMDTPWASPEPVSAAACCTSIAPTPGAYA